MTQEKSKAEKTLRDEHNYRRAQVERELERGSGKAEERNSRLGQATRGEGIVMGEKRRPDR